MSDDNRFVFSGLDELREALRALPADLALEASGIVLDAGNAAADTVREVYEAHAITQHLADSVTVGAIQTGTYGAGAIVRVNDPIAWLFDNGSQARHYMTKRGAEHATGTMWGGTTPPTHIFAGTMARTRRAMYETLKDLLVRHGLAVSGDA
jgi:hypothetical protein